ncbi:hypothetical protein [Nostoc sp.]|uniref:hypothetical protein n=1 Tax=Nostoc sp. TaxID=1180 RepID=UPI002FFD15A4
MDSGAFSPCLGLELKDRPRSRSRRTRGAGYQLTQLVEVQTMYKSFPPQRVVPIPFQHVRDGSYSTWANPLGEDRTASGMSAPGLAIGYCMLGKKFF